MKKIAFHLNSLERGGAERVVSNLAEQFAANGYEVFIATEWQGDDEYTISDRIHRVHVGLTDEQKKHSRKKQFFDRIRNLHKWVKKEKPDVLVAFARKANYRALTATIGTKVPTVISVRIAPVGSYDHLSDTIQIALLFPRAAGAVFQTVEQKEFFPGYLQKKSKVILNAINPKFIGNEFPTQREKVVVHSGRIVDFKNQMMLINAFIKVHEKHPDYSLKIFGPDSGDGTLEKLEKLIATNNANDYVFLMGGSDQLEKDMINGAVAAFSSDVEGMPNAMLEAMALGLPVVATDCPPGGPRMVIRHKENGLLIPVGDERALTEAICYLIENPDEAEKIARSASMVGQKAGSEKIFREWEEYLKTICK